MGTVDPMATHASHVEGENWAYGTTFGIVISDTVTDSAGHTPADFSEWPRTPLSPPTSD